MRQWRIALMATMAAASATACERIVSVSLPNEPPRLVVEARIERVQRNVTGNQVIRLTQTSQYFDSTAARPARAAVVRVTDDLGVSVLFTETSPGVYATSALRGDTGRTYTLSISFQGEQYEGVELLHSVAAIDTLYFAPPEHEDFGDPGGLRVAIDFQEPAGDKNWYLWEQFIDGKRLLGASSEFRAPVVASDLGLDGRAVKNFQPFRGRVVLPGQNVLMRQLALSEDAFRYFRAVGEQTSNGGSPFAVPPASVRGNVRNVTAPDRPALGYFIATDVAEARSPP